MPAMTPERWHQITHLFHQALVHDPSMRDAFLDDVCAGDGVLCQEVKALLEAHLNAGGFGERPVLAASEPAMPFAAALLDGLAVPGTTLGNYRIERVIGRGGMGVVCLAHDMTLHRPVALKLLGSQMDVGTAHARLLREARIAAGLNHPSICTVHEVGGANGIAFIAMEYVEGRPLAERLNEGVLPLEDAIRYGIQAADALGYAHDHGVVHRDFKAANVMLATSGALKIVDFGLAQRTEAPIANARTIDSLTDAGLVAGTPHAMAPEQVRGEVADARADIWSFGVLLHEMVGGVRPFDGTTAVDLFSSILRDAPRPLPDSVPIDVRAIVGRCLEKDPDLRYQHGRDLHSALTAIHARKTVEDTPRARITRRQWVALACCAGLVPVAAIVADVGTLRERLVRLASVSGRTVRVAVLPFTNLTGDPSQEYFSDGLTEEVITQLGRLHSDRFGVIARTSAMRYKRTDKPIDQIARELGADYVLEGSARRDGDRVRITTQLIRARDQTQVWADSFERQLSGILSVQSDIARGVAGSLAIAIIPAEQASLLRSRPVSPDAFDAYLKGREHLYKATSADFDAALKYFELALEKDANFAPAYAGISAVWSGRQQYRFASPRDATPKAKAAVETALALDSALAEAHHRLAVIRLTADWDWSGVEQEFKKAIDLNPGYPDARSTYSHLLNILKRPTEALSEIARALQIDPFNTQFKAFYGRLLHQLRRYDDAIAQYDEVLRIVPNHTLALNGRREAFFEKRMFTEAFEGERAVWTARNDSEMVAALDRGYTEGGYPGGWRRGADTLAARSRTAQTAPVDIWVLYVRAGDHERALEWLDRGYQSRDPNMIYLGVGPIYDPLRDDVRFQDLLRRMKLPS